MLAWVLAVMSKTRDAMSCCRLERKKRSTEYVHLLCRPTTRHCDAALLLCGLQVLLNVMVSTSDDDDDDGDNDELEGEVSGTDDAVSQPRSRGRQRSAKSSRDGRQGSARSQGSRKRNNWVHASAQQRGALHKNTNSQISACWLPRVYTQRKGQPSPKETSSRGRSRSRSRSSSRKNSTRTPRKIRYVTRTLPPSMPAHKPIQRALLHPQFTSQRANHAVGSEATQCLQRPQPQHAQSAQRAIDAEHPDEALLLHLSIPGLHHAQPPQRRLQRRHISLHLCTQRRPIPPSAAASLR